MGFASEGQGCCAPSWQGWLWAPMAHATDVLVLLISVLVPSVSEGAFFIFYCFKMGGLLHTDTASNNAYRWWHVLLYMYVEVGSTCTFRPTYLL